MQKINAIVAGRGTIGLPLIDELKRLGHNVLCSFTRKQLWRELASGSERIKTLPGGITETTLAESLDCYCAPVKDVEMKADVAFIAIPSSGKGEEEMALVEYFRSRGVHIITFAKGAFAYRYRELQPHLGHIGRRGVVGGRVGVLRWLQTHHLCDKDVTMHAVLNASNNMFFDECHKDNAMEAAFASVKRDRLAEPGAKDVVSFVNGELRDTKLKMAAAFSDGLAPFGGPFVTADDLPDPVAVTLADLRAMTLPSRNLRPIVRITRHLDLPLEFERDSPGSMFVELGGYQFSLGFYDIGPNNMLAGWSIGGGAWNGVRGQHDDGVEGPLTTGGLGAGPGPTIGSALCDLADYMKEREQVPAEPKQKQAKPATLASENVAIA